MTAASNGWDLGASCEAVLTHRHGRVQCDLISCHNGHHEGWCVGCPGLESSNVTWIRMREEWPS